ncbi:MAG: hypothetical protein HY360_19470 [Verrucomicrobia bacterium]|nr:hypothetical protein [Verrucomicrobiota bacterium]
MNNIITRNPLMKINWPKYLAQYDLICEMQSRVWQDGTPLGNGSLAALAFEPHHLEWTINKNDIWDYRRPQFKRHSMEHMRRIVREDLDYREEMQKENGPDIGRYSCPKTGGQLRIRFGFDSIYAPAHRISKRLSLYDATLRTALDKHLSHPRVASFIHPTENVMVVQVRDVSAATAFHNKVDLYRAPDAEMPPVRRGAAGDTIWLEQRFYADAENRRLSPFRYALMARVVPRGARAYRDFFRRTVQKKWWRGIEPSKKIASQISGEFAVANVSGDFDLFVTIVTSLEAKNPLAAARRKLAEAARKGSEKLHAEHRRWWAGFWPKNYVGLSEPLLEQLWYVSQYNLATVLPGVPVGALCGLWFGPMETPSQILPWMGHYTNDYNTQLPVAPVFRINRPELADGSFRTLLRMLPQARRNSRELYGLPGAFYPLATDPTGCEVTNGPYRFCQDSGPYWSVFLWWHYLYTRDADYLKRVTYPIMREVATFFANYMVWHADEQLYHLEISQNPELHIVKFPDPVDTLSCLKYTLRAVIKAARVLDCDHPLARKWQHVLDHFPPYPFYENEISPLRGLRPNHLNHVRTLLGLFPCGELDPDIAPQWKHLCRAEWKRTDFWSKLYCCNQGRIAGYTGLAYHLGLTALWLGLRDDAWSYFEDLLKANVKPSGLIAHNSAHLVNSRLSEKNLAHIPQAGIYHDFDPGPLKAAEVLTGRLMESATENLDCRDTIFPILEGPGCYLLQLSEALLQSHNGILRFFRGMPDRMDAAFAGLRAQGPTLVAAARKNGRMQFVQLKALAAVAWKLSNPWRAGPLWFRSSQKKADWQKSEGEYLEVNLHRNETLTLAASKPNLAGARRLRPRAGQPAQPRMMRFADGMLCWLGKPRPAAYYTSLEKARKG